MDYLGIKVSTGPVVNFRLKEHLRDMPETGTVPLIYPGHLSMTGTVWPVPGLKKPNAILRNDATEKWLYSNGFYCVVRRFSSKEEKRRVVASVVDPAAFGDHSVLGFENHMNLFHENKRGLPELLARGLVVYTLGRDDRPTLRASGQHAAMKHRGGPERAIFAPSLRLSPQTQLVGILGLSAREDVKLT